MDDRRMVERGICRRVPIVTVDEFVRQGRVVAWNYKYNWLFDESVTGE